ncbi:MAG: AbrB/MazE/SpoVT family DNA-binding domain-containing protein [Candidatus Woesearchaeota archaeon]
MKRKIIKQGHNTLTMTLPSKWAEKFNIKAGDEIDLVEQGKDLKITTEKTNTESERVVVDISGQMVTMVWRMVSSAYRAGYDEIKIVFENKSFKDLYTAFTYDTIYALNSIQGFSALEAIQALVNRFVGFEIIEQKSNYVIIKDLGETTGKEFENTLRRIFLLLLTMADAIMGSIKGKKDELKAFHMIDTNLDRFEDFCLRILNKQGYSDFKKTPIMFTLIFLIEMVGDEYKKMGLHILKLNKMSPGLKEFITLVDSMVRDFYDLYYNFSKEKAAELYKKDAEGYKLFDKVWPKTSTEEKELLHHLKKIGKLIYSLTELRIDLAY